MIQRIQSIFLFLASGSCLALLGLPFATTDEAKVQSELFTDSQFNVWDHYALVSIFIVAGVILLASIFLFNNRKLQMRLSMAGLSMIVAGAGLSAFFFFQDSVQSVAAVGVGAILPVLGLVFSFLSYRFIKKDEKLVKSMDRLR